MSSTSSSQASTRTPEGKKRKRYEEETSDEFESSDSEQENISVEPGDDPVLSHAAKRKQKKKERQKQPAEENDSSPSVKKQRLKDGSAAAAQQSKKNDHVKMISQKKQNSIWVGNLSFKTTEENIRSFFEERSIRVITRINMPTKAAKGPGLKKENRGFAYVDFDTPKAKDAAIALSEQPLLGRKLLIKDGDDFSGHPILPAIETVLQSNGPKKTLSKYAQKILKSQRQPPAPTLFFGNLGFETTEGSIRELLEAHHPNKNKGRLKADVEDRKKGEPWIRKIRVGTFEDSGKCKGFAFVDFTSTEHATSVLINPKNHHLDGRDLVVEYAGPEAVRRGAPKDKRQKLISKPATKPHKNSPDSVEDDETHLDEPENVQTKASLEFSGQQQKKALENQKGRNNWMPRGRLKPGAALALAKRESAAIVPSQGQKIKF